MLYNISNMAYPFDGTPHDGPDPAELEPTVLDPSLIDPSIVVDESVTDSGLTNVFPIRRKGSNVGLPGILADLDAGFGFTDPDVPVGTGALNKLLPHLHSAGFDRLREALGLPAEPTSWEEFKEGPDSDTDELIILDIEPPEEPGLPRLSDYVILDYSNLDYPTNRPDTEPEDDRFILKGLFPKRRELSEYRIDKDPTRSPYDINFINEYFVEPETPDTYQLPVVEHRWLPELGLGDGSRRPFEFWDGVEDLSHSLLFDTFKNIKAVTDPVTGLINFVYVPKAIEIEEPATEEQTRTDTAD